MRKIFFGAQRHSIRVAPSAQETFVDLRALRVF
jgi:hypothetical protein